MLRKLKKSVAVVLVVTFLMSMFVIAPSAAEKENEGNSDSAISANDYSLKGNNSVGNLIADEIADYQSQQSESEGNCVITDIEVSGNIATVSYSAEINCTILVAIYDENTGVMLASGKAEASSNEEEIKIEVETDSMPSAFVLQGFMLNNSNEPVSESYYSEMYTTDMQQLMHLTVNDFEPEKVLNIDDNPSTNFMVYSDDVKKFECNEDVNTVKSKDSESNTYVFTNADEKLKGLKPGDIFVCDDDPQNAIIFKVGEISVDGDTVTVTTTETSLEQVFDCVKIESTASLEDSKVDESTGSRGITYIDPEKTDENSNNKKNVSPVGAAYDDNGSVGAVNIEKKAEYDKEFKFSNDGVEDDSDEDDGWVKFDGEFKGNIGIRGSIGVDIYLTLTGKKAVSLILTVGVYYKTTISGTFEINPKLPDIEIPVLGNALKVDLTFGLIVRVTGEFEFVVESSFKVGFGYTSGGGFKNLSEKPKTNYAMSLEGEVFVGFTVDITAVVVDDDIGEVGYGAEIGFDITASPTQINIDVEDVTVNHDCKKCVSGDISLVIELDPIVKIGGKDMLKKLVPDVDFTTKLEWELSPWFYSFTHDDFGLDICRYASVSFNIKVFKDGEPVEGADVIDTYNGVSLGKTNFAGILNVTLDGNETGLYQLYADKDNSEAVVSIRIKDFEDILALEEQEWHSFKSADNYNNGYYELNLTEKEIPEPTTKPDPDPQPTTKPGPTIIDSGTCGDNATWELLSNGTLNINGSGDMYNYNDYTGSPWYEYRNQIIQISISYGITSIGGYAFSGCSSLTNIQIPNSVTSIGTKSFYHCESLTNITIPDGVTSIGKDAFYYCSRLTNITIPDGVTSIGDNVFYGCTSLTNIQIPDGVTSIGTNSFYHCESLTNITIPDSVTSIGSGAFSSCSNLTSITIPDSVTSIGDVAFLYCLRLESIEVSKDNKYYSSVDGVLFNKNKTIIIAVPNTETYVIPDSVTSIGDSAFRYCLSLESVTIPNSVTSIGDNAFCDCWSLKSVTIPNSVTSIGAYAFDMTSYYKNADNWENDILYIGKYLIKAKQSSEAICNIKPGTLCIADSAFSDCTSLTDVTIPDSVTSIGNRAFESSGLTSITIPDSVTSIGEGTFSLCRHLTSITIPDNVTSIGEIAFFGCTSLTNITIPDSVTSIDYRAFYESGLQTICGYSGSYAETYANDNGYRFIPLDDEAVSSNNISTVSATHIRKDDNINSVGASAADMIAETVSAQTLEIVSEMSKITAEYSKVAYADYIIAVVKDPNAEDVLSADNLLYINQYTADKDGKISASMPVSNDVGNDYEVLIFGAEVGSDVPDKPKKGDVDGDGKVNIDDVTLIQKYIANMAELDSIQLKAADVNGDENANIDDVTMIQKVLAGMVVLE